VVANLIPVAEAPMALISAVRFRAGWAD